MTIIEVAHNPLRIRSWGVMFVSWVEKSLHKLPTKFLTMNNTILAILHTLNILAFVTEIAVKSAVHIITFTIVVVLMTKEFVTVVYNNRREILEKINNIRNSVGYHFVYSN